MKLIKEIKKSIKDKGRLLLMFSGGLDSTLLARLAHDALGKNAAAITIDSPIIPEKEIDLARQYAQAIGIHHFILPLDEIEDAGGFSANTPTRCYICRKFRHKMILAWAHENDFNTIADGMNFSDLDDYRPGIRAAAEDMIWQPFIEFEVTKDMIRDMSRALRLPVCDKTPTPCLSSRFPYGSILDRERIKRVETAEELLKGLGFDPVRVRYFPFEAALIELDDIDNAVKLKDTIVKSLSDLGFLFISLNLEGFRSGTLNKAIL